MADEIAKPPETREDSRAASRQRVLLGGKIVYGDGTYSLDCSIRDVSALGARLGIRGATVLPKNFHLLDLRKGVAYDCEVVWRNASLTGVKFHDTFMLAEAKDGKHAHLRRLYVEACLR